MTSTTSTTILYPVARDQDGSAVHIDEWKRGQEVTCFGCGQDLIGRLPHDGIKPTAHFAHKSDTACSGETALHKAAKAAIADSHARGVLQFLSWACPHCARCLHQTDLRSLVLRVEERPCKDVVSDVLGLNSSGEPCVAIEVVVTHDVEAETLERYRACGIYVFTLRPSWGSVGDIARSVDPLLLVEHRVGNVDTALCEGCQQVLREKAEWENRLRAQKATAWWSAWKATWSYVEREALEHMKVRQRVDEDRLRRAQAWWITWSMTWSRIAEQINVSWWMAWRQTWREIGDRYVRPYRWWSAWRSIWDTIGKQHAMDEAERGRLRAEEKDRQRALRSNWWDAWTSIWPNIAQRESGTMAAWRPICRRCRQDLIPNQFPDHLCARPAPLDESR